MALDPSIPLSVKPFSINSPFESLGQLMQLRNEQQRGQLQGLQIQGEQGDLADKQRARDDAIAYQRVMANADLSNPDTVLKQIQAQAPMHAKEFQQYVDKARADAVELSLKNAQIGNFTSEAEKRNRDYVDGIITNLRDTYESDGAPAAALAWKVNYPILKAQFKGDTSIDQLNNQFIQGVDGMRAVFGAHAKVKEPKTEAQLAIEAHPNDPAGALAALRTPAAKPDAPKVGTLEDYLLQTYGPRPSPAQILQAKAKFDAAGHAPEKTGADTLVKVEHKDATGKTVIEWLPRSSLAGQIFEAPTSGTVQNRLASAQAVNQTGQDIIKKLSDPAYARNVGVAMGRVNSIKDFIGNPPPEYSDLAGMIESYAIANMGVHGMRSTQGAEEIKKLMDKKHTPESLIATIRGLSAFSSHFMENEGMKIPSASATAPSSGGTLDYADYLKSKGGK